ncbi:MAG: DNA polymerase I [Candidatus Schekmanbacteria bacterium GWA2_38_11]|uniref:DNA polymerase I n=1 Tax=Candidatus Schekmanbacteria bacterium GWA2_38_11 TaxID=1817876 RepID=A0A1F7RNY9_9BACT|nr:MAG: DNA polymerase I [Candidatus Schekmanbacteria bacterium GWA2_38_11]
MGKHLFLIDGSNYIYRAFYATPYLSNSKGLPTNAILSFTNMVRKLIKEHNPEYLAFAFDRKEKTFRQEEYKEYKAKRPPMPENLIPQIPYIKKIVELLNIPLLETPGFEADDIIGTVSLKAINSGFNVTIVSGDKDLMQLVGDKLDIFDTMTDKRTGIEEVKKKFGVSPDKVVDVMGLAGDPSDNIPGVPGIGPKTGAKLIQEFSSLENLFENIKAVKKNSLREKIEAHAEQARLSKRLATIRRDVSLEADIESFKLREPYTQELVNLFAELEFRNLLKEFTEKGSYEDKEYKVILSEVELLKLTESLKETREFAFDTETTSLEPMEADLVGLSFCINPGYSYYIPVAHNYENCPEQIPKKTVLNSLKPVLEDQGIKKIGQNIKYDNIILKKEGIDLKGISFDTMLASYLINPSRQRHNLDDLSLEYIGSKMISYSEVTSTLPKGSSFASVEIEKACTYSCEDSDVALKLSRIFDNKLEELDLKDLFVNVEMPLLEVLVAMEMKGVKVNEKLLKELSKKLDDELKELIEKIYSLAGREFNINSSQQLGEILFKEMKLPPAKKTKSGYSTDLGVLEELAIDNELPRQVLNYRHISKLKSTYVDALPRMINEKTGRIHTSYNQAVTATGRLSSSNPNLQNIPIKTEYGKKIREAFITEPGYMLLCADYSQIELRILAHMSGDELLVEAFRQNQDIHIRTASEIFGLEPDLISEQMRNIAKTVNFGIIYGISSFTLSRDLGISQKNAKKYIDNYFERHKGVSSFIEDTVKYAEENGYVKTLLNRRRYIPELKSRDRNIYNLGRRTAVNTVIQGTAADAIKVAMIKIYERLKKINSQANIILQVHDELVFEVPEKEVENLKNLIKNEMETVLELNVPLKVNIFAGKNWLME